MRQPSPRRWHSWRSAQWPARLTPDARVPRMVHHAAHPELPPPLVPAALKAEAPDDTGVRRGLVAHVRRLIEAGAYDDPEVWAAAERKLLARLDD